MDKKNTLFAEFDACTTAEWEAAIIKSLKGRDYDETLFWSTHDDLTFAPYYRTEDLQLQAEMPGKFPFTRGFSSFNNGWDIRYDVPFTDAAATNKKILHALQEGASSIFIEGASTELDVLLNEVSVEHIGTHFMSGADSAKVQDRFLALLEQRGLDGSAIRASFGYDPIGLTLASGEWNIDSKTDLADGVRMAQKVAGRFPLMHTFTVNGWFYPSAGSGWVQEMGYALAQGHEYLVALLEGGLSIDDAAACIRFELSTGSYYFPEIAKLRAFRKCWANILLNYSPEHECSMAAHIHCRTSAWSLTALDHHNNMLRATTQAMSAVLGGCQSISVLPYDAATASSDPLAEKLALHMQLVLKEEAYLDKVNDAAAGSYYIESLTERLAHKAWKLFQDIEKEGGFIKAIHSGSVQDAIRTMSDEKKKDIESGEIVLLGVNKFPHPNEKETVQPFPAANPSHTVEPLQFWRAEQVANSSKN